MNTGSKPVLRLLASGIGGVRGGLIELVKRHAMTSYARRTHQGVYFGPGAYADPQSVFEGPNRVLDYSRLGAVRMGRHSYCALECILHGCSIGRFCSIGPQVMIGLGSHPTDRVSTFPGFYSPNQHTANFHLDTGVVEHRRVVIGNDVWIGARAVIPGGITIGDGAIIAAGAVVTKDVAPYMIVGGVPAKAIRPRMDEQTIRGMVALKWWDWTDDQIRSRAPQFHDPLLLLAQTGVKDG